MDGIRKDLKDFLERRLLANERTTPITLHPTGHEDRVLLVQRLIQPHLRPQTRQAFCGGIISQNKLGRIPRDQPQQQEHDCHDADHRGDDGKNTPTDITSHRALGRCIRSAR